MTQLTDLEILDLLKKVRVIAMVGVSANEARPSHVVMRFMQNKGYRVIPVNPGLVGGELLGEKVYGMLSDIPEPVDMVDIFRNSEAAGLLVKESIQIGAKVVWMQLGVENAAAASEAEAAGIQVVMNRCPKIELSRV